MNFRIWYFTRYPGFVSSGLAAVDKRHDKRNESSRGKDYTYYIKTGIGKIESSPNTENTNEETEQESKQRFKNVGVQKPSFHKDTMRGLLFGLSDEAVCESRQDRIIFLQYIRRWDEERAG
jgi:hypothetical protein